MPRPAQGLRGVGAWAALATALLALRLPLLTLPGLGRDEATYVYWSHHPEPGYAPLLQLLLALGRPLPLLVEARWVPLVAGAVVLVLFERWLRRRGLERRDRWIAVALVGLCPWQTYAGSILHPDDLQLALVLGFVLAARPGHVWWAAVLAGLAPWAKTSGLLVTAVGAWWVWRSGHPVRGRALIVLVALAAPAVLALDPELLRGILSFARTGPDTGPLARVGLFVLGTVVLAGPILPVLAVRGGFEIGRRGVDPGVVLALAFVAAFGGAAVVTGQVKGNWMLPAILLLWPAGLHWTRPARAALAIGSTGLLSAVIVFGFVRVDLTRALETRWETAPSYLGLAGTRERSVASATDWWHRLAEYRSLDALCSATAAHHDVEVVISDDYGLAAQWATRCPSAVPRLVLPDDPIFAGADDGIPVGALVIAVRRAPSALLGTRSWAPAGTMTHPITGEPVALARVTGQP